MKTTYLFKAMEELVNKHVKAWKTDLEYDKNTIKGNPSDVTYYWYLRESGTQLFSASDLKYIETGAPEAATHWLSRAKAIYKIDITAQELKPINEKNMMDLITLAKPMTDSLKLQYLSKWMSKKEFQTNERPWEILYLNVRGIKFSHYRIDNLVNEGAKIKEILETLNELLNQSKAS